MYGMEIEEQIESLNTALFNAFILVLTIFLIDFLTLSFSSYLKNLEIQALGESFRKLIAVAPPEGKTQIADQFSKISERIYREETKGLIRKIFSSLFGNRA